MATERDEIRRSPTALTATPRTALTIAGSDPSGGAGIQADLKTFTALGVYGASVVTALTAQNTKGVSGVLVVPPQFIEDQYDAVTSDLAVAAVKTGMLADRATIEAVARCLHRATPEFVIVDPVMVATSGDRLIDDAAVTLLRSRLFPLATVVTPNLPEAAALLETAVAVTESEMREQGAALLDLGCEAVLLKGGHGDGMEAVDLLITRSGVTVLRRPRIETLNTHGTGCTLAAALAAHLANGVPLEAAARAAKDFVWAALHSGAAHKIGAGHGPVDHLFSVRK